MSGYQFRKGNFKEAFRYLHTYNTLKDSTNKNLSLLRESDINHLIDTYEHQQQLDQVASENRLNRIYLITAIIVFLSVAAVILLVVRNWLRSRRDVVRVQELNRQINEQNLILNNTLEELKHSINEKDRILHSVAHDLRNPLGGISSLAGLMLEDAITDDQREQINLVKQTAVNALELINEILEVTNITPARTNMEKADMNVEVNNSVSLLQFKASDKNQSITVELPDEPVYLYINREKIWRVISNLISNAIKFSPINSAIKVSLTTFSDHVQLAVEDDGIGIPEKYRAQLFNMFTDAKRPGTAGERSFGLGLSISKQIVEQFHGRIWFESKAEGGTIFYVSLPLSEN
jgi:signal transduction histidine kinase